MDICWTQNVMIVEIKSNASLITLRDTVFCTSGHQLQMKTCTLYIYIELYVYIDECMCACI